jgi:hypothetical protein
MNRLACLLSMFTLAACGGDGGGSALPDAPLDTGPAGGRDDPGTGTGTLLVDGTVTAEPSVSNTSDPTNFVTSFTTRITRAGVDVNDGTVQIRSTGGPVNLLFDTTTMRWRGAQAGYFADYTLDATSGSDAVIGARVHGPDIHVLTSPLAGATVDSTMPVVVTWSRVETAEVATLQTRQLNAVTIADSGTYSLGTGTLKSKPDQSETESIEIVRSSVIAPAGGLVGSSFRVRIRNSIGVVVQRTQ